MPLNFRSNPSPIVIPARRLSALVIPFLLALPLGACAPHQGISPEMSSLNSMQSLNAPTEEEIGARLENMTVDELYGKGSAMMAEGNVKLAKLHLLVALKKSPEHIESRMLLARIFEKEGALRKAGEIYEAILAYNPEHVPALVALGRLQREYGNPENALELLKAAKELAPSDVRALSELAMTYDLLDRRLMAVPLYREAVDLRPTLPSLNNNLGFHFLLHGQYIEAIPWFFRAMNLAPDNAQIKNNLATAYALSGDVKKALALFEGAVGKAGAYNNIGYLHMTKGDSLAAKTALIKALELNPVFYARAQENLERLDYQDNQNVP